jgi:hypothetical protein
VETGEAKELSGSDSFFVARILEAPGIALRGGKHDQ